MSFLNNIYQTLDKVKWDNVAEQGKNAEPKKTKEELAEFKQLAKKVKAAGDQLKKHRTDKTTVAVARNFTKFIQASKDANKSFNILRNLCIKMPLKSPPDYQGKDPWKPCDEIYSKTLTKKSSESIESIPDKVLFESK